MNTPFAPLARRAFLLVLGGAFVLAAAPLPRALADTTAPMQRLDNQAPSLPLKAIFWKSKSSQEEAPYHLRLKNTSGHTVKASATIALSVVVHEGLKTRDVPAHEIAAGKSWTIKGLHSADKVTVTAEGFAPLELTVP